MTVLRKIKYLSLMWVNQRCWPHTQARRCGDMQAQASPEGPGRGQASHPTSAEGRKSSPHLGSASAPAVPMGKVSVLALGLAQGKQRTAHRLEAELQTHLLRRAEKWRGELLTTLCPHTWPRPLRSHCPALELGPPRVNSNGKWGTVWPHQSVWGRELRSGAQIRGDAQT